MWRILSDHLEANIALLETQIYLECCLETMLKYHSSESDQALFSPRLKEPMEL